VQPTRVRKTPHATRTIHPWLHANVHAARDVRERCAAFLRLARQARVQNGPEPPIMVFVNSKKGTDVLAKSLEKTGNPRLRVRLRLCLACARAAAACERARFSRVVHRVARGLRGRARGADAPGKSSAVAAVVCLFVCLFVWFAAVNRSALLLIAYRTARVCVRTRRHEGGVAARRQDAGAGAAGGVWWACVLQLPTAID
jgi:hypothetical protein